MYVKLVQGGGFMYGSLEDIQRAVNEDGFYNFNDAFLDVALKQFYDKTDDIEYKRLYEMYRDRIRPKVIYEIKDLYEDTPGPKLTIIKRELKKNPANISKIVGSDEWGYQIIPITLEKIHSSYKISEENASEEDLREAVKLYNPDSKEITYLAADNLSIISKLANYKSEFVRIYALEERGKEKDYNRMRREIEGLI